MFADDIKEHLCLFVHVLTSLGFEWDLLGLLKSNVYVVRPTGKETFVVSFLAVPIFLVWNVQMGRI